MNVLVTGVGAIIGQGVLKSLRSGGFLGELHGMDIYPHAYGQFLCDKFHFAERADSPNFVDAVNEIIKKANIDLVIPGIEQDLYRLHAESQKINAKVVLNNRLLIELSKDKWATYVFFKDKCVDLIPTYEKGDFDFLSKNLGLPFVLKPKFSYASKGLFLIQDELQFNALVARKSGLLIFQKRILPVEGEFTIHLFGNGRGDVLDFLAMKRSLASDGSTSYAEYSNNKAVLEYCFEIARITKPVGPTNIQLMLENGKPLLLEINPRFSSSCSIATLMGYNSPMHAISFYNSNESLKVLPKIPKKVVRFIEDWAFPEEQL